MFKQRLACLAHLPDAIGCGELDDQNVTSVGWIFEFHTYSLQVFWPNQIKPWEFSQILKCRQNLGLRNCLVSRYTYPDLFRSSKGMGRKVGCLFSGVQVKIADDRAYRETTCQACIFLRAHHFQRSRVGSGVRARRSGAGSRHHRTAGALVLRLRGGELKTIK